MTSGALPAAGMPSPPPDPDQRRACSRQLFSSIKPQSRPRSRSSIATEPRGGGGAGAKNCLHTKTLFGDLNRRLFATGWLGVSATSRETGSTPSLTTATRASPESYRGIHRLTNVPGDTLTQLFGSDRMYTKNGSKFWIRYPCACDRFPNNANNSRGVPPRHW